VGILSTLEENLPCRLGGAVVGALLGRSTCIHALNTSPKASLLYISLGRTAGRRL
jgi:hypothetical protein